VRLPLLEQVWQLPYQRVTSSQIAGGALADVDVLLVPNGLSTVASNALGPAGRRAIIDWVNGGGRYVGWRGGADLAARIGITTALLSEPKSDIAGTLIRVLANQSSPSPPRSAPSTGSSWSPTRAGAPATTTRSRLRWQATSPERAFACSPSGRPSPDPRATGWWPPTAVGPGEPVWPPPPVGWPIRPTTPA